MDRAASSSKAPNVNPAVDPDDRIFVVRRGRRLELRRMIRTINGQDVYKLVRNDPIGQPTALRTEREGC